jgi:hypothetical protein
MDQTGRLVKICELEMGKIREIKDDLNSLKDMSEQHLMVLVEKAANLSKILNTDWNQICRNDIERKSVRPILLWRNEMKEDFVEIHRIEDKVAKTQERMKAIKKEVKEYHGKRRQFRKLCRNKIILTASFGVMTIAALIFHFVMLQVYHNILVPAFAVMTLLPFLLCLYYGVSLKKELDHDIEDPHETEYEEEIPKLQEQLVEMQEELDFYSHKYDSVFAEIDDFQMEAYPYVEKILNKLEHREDYQKAKNEYFGIMEILRFKQPKTYLFIPEIFLIEEEETEFLEEIQEKMRKLDEYLVQTIETA